MIGMEKLPPVNEIVNFLTSFDPSKLEEMKRQFPEQADLFLPGMKLGIDNASRDEQVARVWLTKTVLECITLACSKLIPEFKQKLDTPKTLWERLFNSAKTITNGLGEKMDLRFVYDRLVSLQIESENVLNELTLYLRFENYGDARPYIRRGNEISQELNKLRLTLPQISHSAPS